jgi:hypothetical protein
MPHESNAIEQAISRAVRDNLERIQRTTDELNQAVNDVVAACASSKPANLLPPMLRAQAGAASIAAALEVLSRFVAITLQPAPRSPLEAEMSKLAGSLVAQQARLAPAVEPAAPAQQTSSAQELHPAPYAEPVSQPSPHSPSLDAHPVAAAPAHSEPAVESHTLAHQSVEPDPVFPADTEVETAADFDVNHLSPEEQELHRRANRVAKVSMQDIKMLRPDQVRLGREHKDLCIRLRDDIEKAHREYDRRFRPIMDHPVDYFYRWMVEILADGDAHALGEYPYAVHANQR